MNETMGAGIARRRKELGMTQEQLANALNISYQAVSKWENELSSPDISTLPLLADLFGITIDELFGREAPSAPVPEDRALIPPAAEEESDADLPWPDDDTLRAVLFLGRTPLTHEDLGRQPVTLHIEGDALNIQSAFDVEVEGKVRGNVNAGRDVDCGDVGGSVSAVGDVDCSGVSGDVQAGGSVDCSGVGGSVTAGRDVDCSSVGANVYAGGDVDCGSVGGRVFDGDSGKRR